MKLNPSSKIKVSKSREITQPIPSIFGDKKKKKVLFYTYLKKDKKIILKKIII